MYIVRYMSRTGIWLFRLVCNGVVITACGAGPDFKPQATVACHHLDFYAASLLRMRLYYLPDKVNPLSVA